MSAHTVYGLRLRGEREVRYIGTTRRGMKHRLRTHMHQACWLQVGTPLGQWLRANKDNVEIFAIATTDDSQEALGIERTLIAFCLRLNQRLFNRAHVPLHLQLVSSDEEIAA